MDLRDVVKLNVGKGVWFGFGLLQRQDWNIGIDLTIWGRDSSSFYIEIVKVYVGVDW